jgi:exonuclease III
VGYFNTPLSPMDRPSRQELNRKFMKLTDIYRIFHSNTKEYTFFSALMDPSEKIDHIVCHKASLNRY